MKQEVKVVKGVHLGTGKTCMICEKELCVYPQRMIDGDWKVD